MDKKRKGLVLSIIGIITVILITVGVTYAFFNYVKEGTTDNVITTGSITFLYTEVSGVGNGISIENAFPTSDEKGKVLTGAGEYFDFKITSKTAGMYAIPYEVTARKSSDSADIDENIRVYLTKGIANEEVLLDNYNNLTQTTKVEESKYTEKTIYKGEVPEGMANYEESFRLRMWLDEDTRFENETMNNKKFTLTVNVYANARVVTNEEIAYESNANISTLSIEGTNLTKVESGDYHYEIELPKGTTTTEIVTETENPNATVEIEKIDSLVSTNNVKRLSATNSISLTEGFNYFKVTVTSENKKRKKEYKLKIYMGDIYSTYNIGDEITLIDGSKWHVLENTDKYNPNIVLLSDYNLNSDGTYNDECGRDINSTYKCNPIAFDSNNTNTYDETDSNNIGYFIKNTYMPKAMQFLAGTSKVTLPTADQIALVDGQVFNQSSLTLESTWLLTTNYWTKTAYNSDEVHVFGVYGEQSRFGNGSSNGSIYYGVRPTITTPKSNIVETLVSTQKLSIGTAVEAVDGSKWHVLEASSSDSKYVTLLSDYNLNTDGSYNNSCSATAGDLASEYRCSPIVFDEDNTNTYDESDSNNIGYFIKNTYSPIIKKSLLETTNITLPKATQIAAADGFTFSNSGDQSITSQWLLTTNYWTKTDDVNNANYVWRIRGYNTLIGSGNANNATGYGARPVITTLKTNLLTK